MSTLLILKLALVPAFIAAITIISRWAGDLLAGVIGAFPVVAAPILFLLAYEHGQDFATRAALGFLIAIPASSMYMVVYARAAGLGARPWLALTAAVVSWPLVAGGMLAVAPSLAVAIGIAIGLTLVLPFLLPATEPGPARPTGTAELAARVVVAALLVLAVTGVSQAIGPRWSGAASMWPVATPILAVFTHAAGGARAAISLLHGMMRGMYALTAFGVVVAVSLESGVSIPTAFTAATVAAVAVQTSTLMRVRPSRARPRRRTDPEPGLLLVDEASDRGVLRR